LTAEKATEESGGAFKERDHRAHPAEVDEKEGGVGGRGVKDEFMQTTKED